MEKSVENVNKWMNNPGAILSLPRAIVVKSEVFVTFYVGEWRKKKFEFLFGKALDKHTGAW